MYRDETKWNEMSRAFDFTIKERRDSDRPINHPIKWVSGCDWLIQWVSEWMWLIDPMSEWMSAWEWVDVGWWESEWMWLIDWLSEWVDVGEWVSGCDWLIDWSIILSREWVSEWVDVDEWVSGCDWLIQWVDECLRLSRCGLVRVSGYDWLMGGCGCVSGCDFD